MSSINTFVNEKGGPITAGAVSSILAVIALKLHLNIPATTENMIAAIVVSVVIPTLVHLFDHNYNNQSPTNPAAVTPTPTTPPETGK